MLRLLTILLPAVNFQNIDFTLRELTFQGNWKLPGLSLHRPPPITISPETSRDSTPVRSTPTRIPGIPPIPKYDPLTKTLLGSGLFGNVYQVQSDSGNFVIKEIEIGLVLAKSANRLISHEEVSQATEEFHNEIQALAALEFCPYTPKLLGAEQVFGTLQIAMTQADGESLDTLGVDEGARALIDHQLKDALDYFHSLGIAHLDIKPAHLFWDQSSKQLTLIDFGASRFFNPTLGTTKKLSAGTTAYRTYLNTETDVRKIDLYAAARSLEKISTGSLDSDSLQQSADKSKRIPD